MLMLVKTTSFVTRMFTPGVECDDFYRWIEVSDSALLRENHQVTVVEISEDHLRAVKDRHLPFLPKSTALEYHFSKEHFGNPAECSP